MILIPKHEDTVDVQRKTPRTVPATMIKKSTVPEAGLGLFAGETIEKGEHVGWYDGEVYVFHPENDSKYILYVQRKPAWISEETWETRETTGMFIDSCPDNNDNEFRERRFSRLNHAPLCNKKYKQKMKKGTSPYNYAEPFNTWEANVKFLNNGRIVALKNIQHNEELFIDYGDDFFEEQ